MHFLNTIFNYFLYVVCRPHTYARMRGVTFGKNCNISTKSWGSEPYLIEIGNHVHVTKGVKFINHDGSVWIFRESNPNFDVFGKICIGDNTFIGNDSTILYGVTIGKNCIIGACSVVTKSVPDGCIIAGNPARFICNIEDFYNKIISYNTNLKQSKNKKSDILKLNDNFFIKKKNLKI